MQTKCMKDSETSVSANDLGNIFREIGSRYGYEKIEASFTEFRDFKPIFSDFMATSEQ